MKFCPFLIFVFYSFMSAVVWQTVMVEYRNVNLHVRPTSLFLIMIILSVGFNQHS